MSFSLFLCFRLYPHRNFTPTNYRSHTLSFRKSRQTFPTDSASQFSLKYRSITRLARKKTLVLNTPINIMVSTGKDSKNPDLLMSFLYNAIARLLSHRFIELTRKPPPTETITCLSYPPISTAFAIEYQLFQISPPSPMISRSSQEPTCQE